MTSSHDVAHPPETVEGWYALHQIFRCPGSVRLAGGAPVHELSTDTPNSYRDGWTARVELIGSSADLMLVHFYPTLERIREAQLAFPLSMRSASDRIGGDAPAPPFELVYSFLSVTEAGLYHITAQLAAEAEKRGGSVGDENYRAQMAERVAAESAGEHVRKRLYPEPPAGMPYVCFYPMSKRRQPGQNWYALSLAERSRLMQAHGITGRKYAGRVQQVITGAIGLDAWEWGVTLFAKDPLDFKKLVTDMRFDEVSANFADFGEFFVGKLIGVESLRAG